MQTIRKLDDELIKAHEEIKALSESYGLDCFPIIFELVDYKEINQIAALGGFPTRYPHWRFGMEYDYLDKTYTYGLQKIYELVINNDPCYAYLQMGNEIVDQKLVMAHVYGHCDFFKNNMWFSKTNRKMLDQMANHATKIRQYQDRFGVEVVEDFIDICSSLDSLIDRFSPFIPKKDEKKGYLENDPWEKNEDSSRIYRIESKEYMEKYLNPEDFMKDQYAKIIERQKKSEKFPEHPEKDILKFIIEYAPLENWKLDILSMIREEAYYFSPQGQTKIMNEGWASYWHSTIMTHHVLRDSELIDYADHHSGTMSSSPLRLNPYKLGIELYRDIEDRWNRGKFGKEYFDCEDETKKKLWNQNINEGRKKIFEVRKLYNDLTFIDDFMNEEFCVKQKLFVYGYNKRTNQYEIVDKDWRKVKNQLLHSLTNFGNPIIYVLEGNYENKGELLLEHHHEGLDLDYDAMVATLKNIFSLWKRPVHISTKIENQNKIICYNGTEIVEKDN